MNPAAFASKANAKFAQNGQPMTFVRVTESGSPDPATGLPERVVERVSFGGMWDTIRVNEIGGLIQAGDAVIWAGGGAIPAPDITDSIEVDGRSYDIITIEAIKPGAVAIAYKMYVRGV